MEYNKTATVSSTPIPSVSHDKAHEYVRHSRVPQDVDMRVQSPSRRTFIEKLGAYNIGVLVVGAVAIFVAMAFLSVLWSGAETASHGRPTPVFWFNIVERPNWTTRVVTIGSVLVRLATAAQMGLLAALLAAWTLETTGASAEHLPLLSIIRTVNNGPQSHIWNVFHAIHTGSKFFYSTMIILAILNALALQFTSTILITDFGRATVVPQAHNQSVAYAIFSRYENEAGSQAGKVQASIGVDLNLATPPAYPRFAEFANLDTSHFGTDYADTGESFRAFLPFGQPDAREVLRAYEGPATVLDSRVRCARPSMTISNITFLQDGGTNEAYEIIIAGNIAMDGTIPGVSVNVDQESGSFMCTAMARIYANTTDWRLSYSYANVGSAQTEKSPLVSTFSGNLWPLLLLNITGSWAEILQDIVSIEAIVGPYEWIQEPSGLWTNLKTTNETIDIGISATVCFVGLDSNNLWIRADSERDFAEPRNISWSRDEWKYDTNVVRKMLGATNEHISLNERGLLRLQQPANWTDTIMRNDTQDFIQPSIFDSLRRLEHPEIPFFFPTYDQRLVSPQTAILTPYSQYNSVNRALSAVFQDIIQTTSNPALAFQAMFTTMSQIAYYQAFPLFSISDTARIATSKTYTVPVQWMGFAVVMGLLAMHALLVVTAVVLFLANTHHSLLGNAWMAVAQVASADTMDTVHRASNMTDVEVRRLLRMNSCEDEHVVLKTGADTGRSQAVYRRGVSE